ncbi:MAG: hypothetical protein H7829_00360 [Magnetococcus sp. THC-1_WYH]
MAQLASRYEIHPANYPHMEENVAGRGNRIIREGKKTDKGQICYSD